jgi:hypothetical protein
VPSFARPPAEPLPIAEGETKTVQRPRTVTPLEANERRSDEKQAEPERAPMAKSAPEPAPAAGATKDLVPEHQTRGGRSAEVRQEGLANAGACGSVVDAQARPVANAQVVLANTGVTAVTDAQGRFCFQVPAGTYDLSVFAVGFAPNRQTVELGGAAREPTLAVRTVEVLPPPPPGSSPAPAAIAPKRDGEAGLAFRLDPSPPPPPMPDSVRVFWVRAEQLTAAATAERSAPRLDTAAIAWNGVIARLGPGGAEIQARERLARTRMLAWELVPDGPRTLAAKKALQDFLARDPAGPAREWAQGALARLGP